MFESALGILQLLIVALSLVLSIYKIKGYILDNKNQKLKLKIIEEKDFNKILESNELLILGDYLDNVIGEFTIKDYQTNAQVKTKVDKYLNSVIEFIGSESDIAAQDTIDTPDSDIDTDHEPKYKGVISDEFDLILKDLKYGESWNALARLRRYIEILLNQLVEKNDVNLERHVSAGQLLRILARHEIITYGLEKNLKYVIQVCNRAVHGLPIKNNEAEEVVDFSIGSLMEIKHLLDDTSNNT
jgi:hypothetical protein